MGFFDDFKITPIELDEVIHENPSLRGFILGYMAEFKLKKQLEKDPEFSKIVKYDNHDRSRKGDLNFFYKDVEFSIEIKSIQTNSIKRAGETFTATFQCDASDRRPVNIPHGKIMETTCLLIGEFDVLAVPLFPFIKEWKYAFAMNSELPRTTSVKYTANEQKYLLATSMHITWPLQAPYSLDLYALLNKIKRARKIENAK